MIINKKKCAVGGDGLNFEMVVDGANGGAFLVSTPLTNKQGRDFGEVKVINGKIHIYISLPKLIRENNIIPFSITDMIMLEVVNNDIEKALKNALKGVIDNKTDVLTATVKTIECNITRRVMGDSTCPQVLDLINRSFPERTNVVYQRASISCKYDKENETVIIKKPNYYLLKCYDKSFEQRKSGNVSVEDGLLRVEVVMQDRIIKKLFSGKSTIRDVLTMQGLMVIIGEYKRIFLEDIVGHIKPCVNDVINILFESLKKTDRPIETIALHKELIMDEEIFRMSLVKWYRFKGYGERAEQNASTFICRAKKYSFPKNVLDTMREFRKSCG